PQCWRVKLVNGAPYTAVDIIVDPRYPAHRLSSDPDTVIHFEPPAGIILESNTTRDFDFVGLPTGTVLLTPITVKMDCCSRRPWQTTTARRRGLPCTAAFACTDYKVQGRTLTNAALELRRNRGTSATPCDPYSLYVQLSRCRSLEGITLLSPTRNADLVGNVVPKEMREAEERLAELGNQTIQRVQQWQ
ncbi:DNA repair and recombination protein, partial [Colletotrichum sojae]